MPKVASVEIDTPANKGETKIRRSHRAPDRMLERPADGIETMADVFLTAKKRKYLSLCFKLWPRFRTRPSKLEC